MKKDLVVFGEVALGLDGGFTTFAGGGDGLAIEVVHDVAGGEEAGGLGCGALSVGLDVAGVVAVDEVACKLAVRHVADGDEGSADVEFAFFVGFEVLDFDAGEFVIFARNVGGDGAVPDGLDFFVSEDAFGHDFGGSELVAAVDEVDLGGEAGEEVGFFCCRVASANNGDGHVAVEGTITGGAGGDAGFAEEFLFAFDAEEAGGGSGGDDDGLGLDDFVAAFDFDFKVAGVALDDGLGDFVFGLSSEFFSLLLHSVHELVAVDSVREAGEVFDFGGGGEKSTGLLACEDAGLEVSSAGVECGGPSG